MCHTLRRTHTETFLRARYGGSTCIDVWSSAARGCWRTRSDASSNTRLGELASSAVEEQLSKYIYGALATHSATVAEWLSIAALIATTAACNLVEAGQAVVPRHSFTRLSFKDLGRPLVYRLRGVGGGHLPFKRLGTGVTVKGF